MKTMKKALALVLGLCMLMSLASVSALAEETEYTPTYSYDRFFYGSSGEGFLKTKVDYDNDGEKEDYYIAYGLNGYYTSIDGINWDKRLTVNNLRSLAYGNGKGIAVLEKGNETAYLFDDDLNSALDSPANDGTQVGYVYNKLEGDNNRWIELHPNIYFDEYSGLFFCHGFEYETEGTQLDIGLYYTDGTPELMKYNGADVYALTWTEVEGDLFYVDEEGGDLVTSTTYSVITGFRIYFKGDGNGHILISYGNITNGAHTPNVRANYSFVTTTIDGETGKKTISASYGANNLTYSTPNAIYIGNNIAFLGVSSSKTRIAIGTVNNNVVTVDSAGRYNPTGMEDQNYGFTAVYENDGTVYIIKSLTEIYKTEFNLKDKTLEKIETVNVNDKTELKSITANLFASHSYHDTTIQSGTLTTDNSTYSVKDMLFLNDGSIVLMVNATGGTKNKTYLYRLVTENGATTVTQLHADTTYTHFSPTGRVTDTTAKGYKVDAKFRLRRAAGEDVKAENFTNGFSVELSGDGSEYFSGDTILYTNVLDNAPVGQYTINYFLKTEKQPSIFATMTAVYDVVPRFTTTLNTEDAADEKYTVQLTAGANSVTVGFDMLERYVTSSSANYDTTLKNKFLVMAARYNSNHQMQEVVEIYDTAKLATGSETPYEFNVTNAADGDYVKVFILEGFSTLKPLW